MRLENKIALVTGANDGIGKALVEDLVSRGVTCIAVSRTIDEAEHAAIIQKKCNVANYEDVKGIAGYIKDTFGRLDIVINNAGVWHKAAVIDEIDEKIMDEVINTNLLGTMRVTKYTLPLLRLSSEAVLVNVVSSAGLKAQAGRCAYAASKFGVRGFTDATREDLYNTNIRVLSIYQGGTATGFFEKAGDSKHIERYIDPKDLAKLVVDTIASPKSMWQNELRVDHT